VSAFAGPQAWVLASAELMRALDRHTIEELGVPGEVLMESAGRAALEVVLAELPADGEVLVVCGMGNNGGDGFVVARHLRALGVPVRAALLGEPARLRDAAAAHCARARAAGVPLEGPRWRAPKRGVIVDAIFGTGLSRSVDTEPAASVRRMLASRGPGLRVVALDLPSGVCSETGQVLGVAVAADATVTF
jgi:NAD(P)H-hydrate epimerase